MELAVVAGSTPANPAIEKICSRTSEQKIKKLMKYERHAISCLAQELSSSINPKFLYLQSCVALHDFKKINAHYRTLFLLRENPSKLSEEAEFTKHMQGLTRPYSGSDSHAEHGFLKPLRLTARTLPNVPDSRMRERCIEWLLEFPIENVQSATDIMLSDRFPYNIPHVYMDTISLQIRAAARKGRNSQTDLEFMHRQFLDSTSRDGTARNHEHFWSKYRLPGSYGANA